MELLKVIFLVISSLFCLYCFTKGTSKGICAFLVLFAFSNLLGFSRAVLSEGSVLALGLIISSRKDITLKSLFFIPYLLLTIVITVLKGNPIFNGYGEILLFGLPLLSYREAFRKKEITSTIIVLLFIIVQCNIINLIITSGADAFRVIDADSMDRRLFNGISVYGKELTIDPNYSGFTAGIGVVCASILLRYPGILNQLFDNHRLNFQSVNILLWIILAIDLFYTVRGMSRGAVISLAASLIVLIYYGKTSKKVVLYSLLFIILILLLGKYIPFISTFFSRFTEDNTGGGRYMIWDAIWNVVADDGLLSVLFGEGLNFEWWQYDISVAGGMMLGSHNSWLDLFVSIGVIGVLLILSIMANSFIIGHKSNTMANVCKMSLLTYVFVGCMSIQPLYSAWVWIVLAMGCSCAKD